MVHHADPTDSVISFLRDRRLLLVIDSCEHVIDVVAGLAENIHQRAPGVSILATSRESLLVQGEQIFELVPLQGPPQGSGLSVSQALSYPAVRLFVERATAAGHRADMTDDDAAVLAEICGKLDGIALAIELAAVRVGVHGLREVAALLDGRLKLEWRGRRTAPPRHQTLGATLDWSYGLIDETERVALRRFSVFAGSFTLQGAMAVAGDNARRPIKSSTRSDNSLPSRWFRRGRKSPRHAIACWTRPKPTPCKSSSMPAKRRRSPVGMPVTSGRCLKQPWPSKRVEAVSQLARRSVPACSPMPGPR